MQIDLATVLFAFAGLGLATLVAMIAGTVAARLFFHASGLDADAGPHSEERLH